MRVGKGEGAEDVVKKQEVGLGEVGEVGEIGEVKRHTGEDMRKVGA